MTFPPQKRFFFEMQQPSRFQMVNALSKIEASTEHVYFQYFFCCRIEPVGQPESGNLVFQIEKTIGSCGQYLTSMKLCRRQNILVV